MPKKTIIFTDLDGTLLDYTDYSFEKARPALALIKEMDVPLIVCSSKTKAEIEYYRNRLNNTHPFVSENGGGIFIPKRYFDLQLLASSYSVREEAVYDVVSIGAGYAELRKAIKELQEEGFQITGFGDMSEQELADLANMNTHEAKMAKERYFDEPFVLSEGESETGRLLDAVRKKGFNVTRGRFFHILGRNDKGIAVSVLANLFREIYSEIRTIALGDSPNDLPMLRVVDQPVLVQKIDGSYDKQIDLPNLIKAEGVGPVGWNDAVMRLLSH